MKEPPDCGSLCIMTLGLTRNVFWINRYSQGRGDPTIRNSRMRVGPGPILWNQSGLPKELVGPLNLLVLLLSSHPLSPYPHLTLLYWYPAMPRRGSRSLASPTLAPLQRAFHAGEGLSSVYTRKRAQANRGPSLKRPRFYIIAPLLHNYYHARDKFTSFLDTYRAKVLHNIITVNKRFNYHSPFLSFEFLTKHIFVHACTRQIMMCVLPMVARYAVEQK